MVRKMEKNTLDQSLVDALTSLLGKRFVLSTLNRMRRFTRGYRFGGGGALAVVQPANLLELWKTIELCNSHQAIVIAQAANTGLTGGSTPHGDDYDRDVVVLNTMRIKSIQMLDGGRQVIAFPGTTLDELGSGLVDQSQKMTVAARAIAEKKAIGHLS